MKSIRVRLLLALLAMLALMALLLGGITYRNVLAETEALFDYQLRQMALSLRDQGAIGADQAGALADEQFDFVIQIWTVDGRILYSTRAHDALPSRALLGLADVRVGSRRWRAFSVATRDRVIQVAQPLQIREQLAARAALHSVEPLLLLSPLMAVAVWWLAALTLAPLRRVAAQVRQRDARSLAPLPVTGLPDEVWPLVSAVNALLGRVDELLSAQRAFVADAAHELRSPLTALKLQLQLLRRAPDPAAHEAAIDALGAGIDRAGRLVEQLLTLARTEAAAPTLAGDAAADRPVDLAEAVRSALAATAAFADLRGTTLDLIADAPVTVTGDVAALTVLARNLADNAVRYAPSGSTVQVLVAEVEGAALLQFDDSGPGIAPEARDRVFDRFHRRSDDVDAGGTGLGRAIVRAVATRHGATVALDTSPLGGLRVQVRWPVRGASPTA